MSEFSLVQTDVTPQIRVEVDPESGKRVAVVEMTPTRLEVEEPVAGSSIPDADLECAALARALSHLGDWAHALRGQMEQRAPKAPEPPKTDLILPSGLVLPR